MTEAELLASIAGYEKEIARQCEVIATLKEELDWVSREWKKDSKKLIKLEHNSSF